MTNVAINIFHFDRYWCNSDYNSNILDCIWWNRLYSRMLKGIFRYVILSFVTFRNHCEVLEIIANADNSTVMVTHTRHTSWCFRVVGPPNCRMSKWKRRILIWAFPFRKDVKYTFIIKNYKFTKPSNCLLKSIALYPWGDILRISNVTIPIYSMGVLKGDKGIREEEQTSKRIACI